MQTEVSDPDPELNRIEDTVTLTNKPISINRRSYLTVTSTGIPLIRDIIIIETEASITRIVYFLVLIMIYCTLIQFAIIAIGRVYPTAVNKILKWVVWIAPVIAGIFHKKWLFVGLWVLVSTWCMYFLLLLGTGSTLSNKKPPQKENEQPMDKKSSDLKQLVFWLFHHIYKKISFQTSTKTLYRMYHNLFYYSHIFVTCSLFLMFFSLITERFVLLNISLLVFVYNNYFLIVVQEIIELFGGYVGVRVILGDKKMCSLCGKQIENKTKNPIKELKFQTSYKLIQSIIQKINKLRTSQQQTISHTLPCSHTYHSDCIKGYYLLNKSDKCPVCNEKLQVEHVLDSTLKGMFFFNVFMEWLRKCIIFCVIGIIALLYTKN